jgi:hypothetical protein
MKSDTQRKGENNERIELSPIPGAMPRVHADDRLAMATVHMKSRAAYGSTGNSRESAEVICGDRTRPNPSYLRPIM